MRSLFVLLLLASSSAALEPKDVYIVANKTVPESIDLAKYYCAKRGVPTDHIIELDLPKTEDITRKDYDSKLVAPLREALDKEKAKVLLCVYGVPLRVGIEPLTPDEKKQLDATYKELKPLRAKRDTLSKEISSLTAKLKDEARAEWKARLAKAKKERDAVNAKLRPLENRRRRLSHSQTKASVDSELALLWRTKYPLDRWQINAHNFLIPEARQARMPKVLMTARIDGPSPDLLKRLIDTSIAVEKKGLRGKVYIDARGIRFDPKKDTGTGYGGYDESLRETATLLRSAKMDVTLDNKGPLFAVRSCRECALYCGWYSHAKFVDCAEFVPGAVGYHIASSEAVSLRNPKARYWCKNLLDKGVVATLGPVAEPYTVGFPKPAEFFGFLVTGEHTLVECYWKTALFTSWMTTLVGDPLYNPYRNSSKLKSEAVKPSPKQGKVLFVPTK